MESVLCSFILLLFCNSFSWELWRDGDWHWLQSDRQCSQKCCSVVSNCCRIADKLPADKVSGGRPRGGDRDRPPPSSAAMAGGFVVVGVALRNEGVFPSQLNADQSGRSQCCFRAGQGVVIKNLPHLQSWNEIEGVWLNPLLFALRGCNCKLSKTCHLQIHASACCKELFVSLLFPFLVSGQYLQAFL